MGGRNVILDVHALDEDGSEMDIEVQGNSEGAHVKRARFHSSMVDSRMLRAGQKFRELKDSYVIFIYKHDKFQRGLPIYHVDRYVSETREPFGDGAHIVYVMVIIRAKMRLAGLCRIFIRQIQIICIIKNWQKE